MLLSEGTKIHFNTVDISDIKWGWVISVVYQTSSFLSFLYSVLYTHNGWYDCGSSSREQQLLQETVPVVERFHQSPLLPGTLEEKDTETDYSKRSEMQYQSGAS